MASVVDAIRVSQDIVKHFIKTSPPCEELEMQLPVPVAPAMPLHGDYAAPPTNGIIKALEEHTGYKAIVARVGGLDVVAAYFLRFDKDPALPLATENRIRIVYQFSKDINRCWSRLLICKEASHLLLGCNENYTTSPAQAIDLLACLISDGIICLKNDQVEVEHLAYFSAIEMLMPFQLRRVVKEYIELGMTNRQIAESFLIPEGVVELRCRKQGVIDMFEDAYKELGLI